jgi:F-type H+-transporting ATPase subunit b
VHGVLAASNSGNFLVTPNVGLMIWTLIAFGIALFLLQRLAFPRIGEALDRRRKAIEESIEAAERTRREAETLLEEYRARLREARDQAEDIVTRARKAGERLQEETLAQARESREDLLERTRRDIEAETRRALEQIRQEVAELTVLATEKLARKSLDSEDHRRLIDEALSEIDFSQLAPEGAAAGNGSGSSSE